MTHSLRIGDIHSQAVWELLRTADELTPELSAALRKEFRIGPNFTPDSRLDLVNYCRVAQRTISTSKYEELGIKLAQSISLTSMGITSLCAMCAPTLEDALHTLCRYEPLYVRSYRGKSQFSPDSNSPVWQLYSLTPYNQYTRFVVDASLGGVYNIACMLTKQSLPVECHIEFDSPSYAKQYQSLFNGNTLFSCPTNALIFNASSMKLKNHYHNPQLFEQLTAQCEQQLNKLTHNGGFKQELQHALGPLLQGKTPNIEEAAELLSMPTWTLRRRLKEENTTFQSVLDDFRQDLAIAYMQDIGLTLGEISYMLGFSSPAAFQRAFKRWTGKTPGEYRKGNI